MRKLAPHPTHIESPQWQRRLLTFLKRYRHWFFPSTTGMDEFRAQQTTLLNINMITIMILYLLVIVELAIRNEFPRTIVWVDSIGLVACFLIWRLLFKGYYNLVGIAIIVLICVTMAELVWVMGSIMVPATTLILYIIPLAGLLFRKKGLVVVTLLGSALILGLTTAQINGLMPPADPTPRIGFWINITVIMAGTAFLINAGLVSADRILHLLTRELAERQKAETHLRELNTQLEEMVEKRKAALQQTNANLQKALTTRDTFMNAITKELLVPLGSIRQLAQQMQEPGLAQANPRQQAAISSLEQSGERLASGVGQVLEFTQLQRGEAELNLADVEVGTLCGSMVASYTAPAAALGLKLESQSPTGMLLARCDEARLRQVLDCLLSNAVKFGAGGGSIGISAGLQANQVQISVWDHGIGITKEELPLLYQPFAQLDEGLARRYTGFGLNLAIAKLNADRMGGSLSVQSQPGVGTTFTVTLPAAGEP